MYGATIRFILGKYCEQEVDAAVSLLAMFVANNLTGFGHVSSFKYRRLP